MLRPYDPLNYENLARSVVREMMERDEVVLPPDRFYAAGVYAMYYHGKHDAYKPIVSADPPVPIYVGKAVPAGARKAGASSTGRELWKRLKEHAESIEAAENLRLADFTCRHLVVVPVWIPLAERFLVEHYKPVWNVVVDGFGNHPPGKGRRDMRRPRWDIIHPGRTWAVGLSASESAEDILRQVREFFRERGH